MRISRRSVLIAIPLAGCAGDADARLNTVHVAPDGEGDGSSWRHPAGLRDVPGLVARIEPGGEILVAADRGEYVMNQPVIIARGGQAGKEVRVRGVNSASGEPMPAVLRGDRAGAAEGTDGFRLIQGASHLKFSHFRFLDVGNGAFHVGAPLRNLTIEDCTFENIYRFLENTVSGDGGQASMRDFAVRRCHGERVQRGFLRIRYNSRDGVIEDCRARGLANEGGLIPAGCALDDRAGDIVYRRCVMEGFQELHGGEYWNGDGFSDEPGNFGIRYEACEARGSTDGGFDCKSRDVVLENCVAEDNKRNFRIWSERGTMSGCTSRNPNFRGRGQENAGSSHIWIGGEEGSLVRIANVTIEDSDATDILEFEHDVGRVEIRGYTIRSPRVNWGDYEDTVRATMIVSE